MRLKIHTPGQLQALKTHKPPPLVKGLESHTAALF